MYFILKIYTMIKNCASSLKWSSAPELENKCQPMESASCEVHFGVPALIKAGCLTLRLNLWNWTRASWLCLLKRVGNGGCWRGRGAGPLQGWIAQASRLGVDRLMTVTFRVSCFGLRGEYQFNLKKIKIINLSFVFVFFELLFFVINSI